VGVVVAVVTVMAMVLVTVVLVVVDVALSVISVNIISAIVVLVVVRLGVAVAVVVVVMMVVVVVVLNLLELLGELVDETLIDSLLEFDLVLVVLESVDHGVIEMVLDLEPQDLAFQLVLELLDSLGTEGLVVVVVVAVMTVVVAVVSVVMTVVSVVVKVMAVVLVVVVGMRMLVVVGMDMDGSVSVDLLSGDRGNGDVSRVLLVVMNVNMTRSVVGIPLGNIVTVRIRLGVSGDGLGQGGGETEKGNGDEGGLHIGCSKGLIEWRVRSWTKAPGTTKWFGVIG
jgi:hypothetical protein